MGGRREPPAERRAPTVARRLCSRAVRCGEAREAGGGASASKPSSTIASASTRHHTADLLHIAEGAWKAPRYFYECEMADLPQRTPAPKAEQSSKRPPAYCAMRVERPNRLSGPCRLQAAALEASLAVRAPRQTSSTVGRPKRPPHASAASRSARASLATSWHRSRQPWPREQLSQQGAGSGRAEGEEGASGAAARGGSVSPRYLSSAARLRWHEPKPVRGWGRRRRERTRPPHRHPEQWASERMAAAASAWRGSPSAAESPRRRDQSEGAWRRTHAAGRPSLPARPACCAYSSGDAGGPQCTTRRTSGLSTPRPRATYTGRVSCTCRGRARDGRGRAEAEEGVEEVSRKCQGSAEAEAHRRHENPRAVARPRTQRLVPAGSARVIGRGLHARLAQRGGELVRLGGGRDVDERGALVPPEQRQQRGGPAVALLGHAVVQVRAVERRNHDRRVGPHLQARRQLATRGRRRRRRERHQRHARRPRLAQAQEGGPKVEPP